MASLVFQLKVGAHMWLALHAYRRSPAGAEMMHAVATHVEAAYNVLGGLFPGKTVTEASPKGKQAGANSGTKAKKARSGVNLGTKDTKKEKVAVGAGKSQPRKGASVILDDARLVLLTGCPG